MAITLCTITGSIKNLAGVVPANIAALQAKLIIKNEQSFMHGDVLISPFEQIANFDGSGNVSATCIETATPGQRLQISVTLLEGLSTRTILFEPAIIPNQGSVTLGQLTVVRKPVW